jgi:hypothetical protein
MIVSLIMPGRTIMNAFARRLVATAMLALPALISEGGLCVQAQGIDDIYATAKAEGAFVLYVGGPTAPWEASARIFEQRYPGIKVSITGGFSNVLDKKIDQQLTDNKLEVDTAIFQTLQDFVRWKTQGQLLAFKPAGFDAIDPSFKDKDGAFYGVMVIAMPYMYNTQHVAAAGMMDLFGRERRATSSQVCAHKGTSKPLFSRFSVERRETWVDICNCCHSVATALSRTRGRPCATSIQSGRNSPTVA